MAIYINGTKETVVKEKTIEAKTIEYKNMIQEIDKIETLNVEADIYN